MIFAGFLLNQIMQRSLSIPGSSENIIQMCSSKSHMTYILNCGIFPLPTKITCKPIGHASHSHAENSKHPPQPGNPIELNFLQCLLNTSYSVRGGIFLWNPTTTTLKNSFMESRALASENRTSSSTYSPPIPLHSSKTAATAFWCGDRLLFPVISG